MYDESVMSLYQLIILKGQFISEVRELNQVLYTMNSVDL